MDFLFFLFFSRKLECAFLKCRFLKWNRQLLFIPAPRCNIYNSNSFFFFFCRNVYSGYKLSGIDKVSVSRASCYRKFKNLVSFFFFSSLNCRTRLLYSKRCRAIFVRTPINKKKKKMIGNFWLTGSTYVKCV